MRRLRRCVARFALLACVAAVAAAAPARAASPEETFDAACAAYEQGQWDVAAEGFRSLLRYGLSDARLEYNLGNAEFKRGRLGEAVLHYERARRLAPADKDIAANLAIVRGKIRDVVEDADSGGPLQLVRGAQDRLGASVQAGALLVLLWLVAATITWCGSRVGGFTPAWGWTLAAEVLVLVVCLASWRTTWLRLEGTPRAVILKPSVEALAGPGLNNASLFTLHEGTAVAIEAERESWLQVTLPNGLTGWVVRDAAERI